MTAPIKMRFCQALAWSGAKSGRPRTRSEGRKNSNSIVGFRSVVDEDVVLERTLMMGADYYENEDDAAYNHQMRIPDIGIGKDCSNCFRNTIVDKNAHMGGK